MLRIHEINFKGTGCELLFYGDTTAPSYVAFLMEGKGWTTGGAKKVEGAPLWSMFVKGAREAELKQFLRETKDVEFAEDRK